MKTLSLAGDVVIDWLSWNGNLLVMPGGIGNVERGLRLRGWDPVLTTVFNPAIFPLARTSALSSAAVQDLDYINTYFRDYDSGTFLRFRSNLRKHTFAVNCDIVTIHCDSCIRQFESRFADVKDPSVTGATFLLRLSAEDNKESILKRVEYQHAIVTYLDKVELLGPGGKLDACFEFEHGQCLDSVGAGDAFFTAVIDCTLKGGDLAAAVRAGYECAQQKIGMIGVFVDDALAWQPSPSAAQNSDALL